MLIRGKDRKFELNIQAQDEIAQFCPNNDYGQIGQLLQGGTVNEMQWSLIKVAIAMNRGYEDHRHFDDPDYTPDYLKESDFLFFTSDMIMQLGDEVIGSMNRDSERTVDTKPLPGKKKQGKQ